MWQTGSSCFSAGQTHHHRRYGACRSNREHPEQLLTSSNANCAPSSIWTIWMSPPSTSLFRQLIRWSIRRPGSQYMQFTGLRPTRSTLAVSQENYRLWSSTSTVAQHIWFGKGSTGRLNCSRAGALDGEDPLYRSPSPGARLTKHSCRLSVNYGGSMTYGVEYR